VGSDLSVSSRPEPLALDQRWIDATHAIERLSQLRTLDEVVIALRTSARRVVGADGIAVILREGALCHYIAEDAQAPLWRGQRFDADSCVSGWAMTHRETVAIPDVYLDARVPQNAYRQTFVRSMLMVPIGREDPVAAIGAYWSEAGQPSANEIALLEVLARAASTALENGRLLASLEEWSLELEQRVVDRTAELERTQASIRQTQKMEVIGQLTGNVAHDFNNLLSPIMSSLDLVLGGRASPTVVARSAAVAMDAAENAKTLVQRLLAFARRQPLIPTAVEPDALLEAMRSLLKSAIGPRGTVELRVEPGLPAIRADRNQLEMALLNLAVNARDAMPDGGRLTLSAESARAPLPPQLGPGSYVCLAVRDTGCGMDAKTVSAATEPFFTTKTVGHGTGLGLSMVDGLTSQLGGALQIESQLGKGTEVRLWLPIAGKAEAGVAQPEPATETTSNQGKILLVDDDALVRLGTSDMLSDLGYEVTEAEDAREGLDLIDRGFHPDVVVTDHIMPGITGAEFALRLRSEHPEIAILIISGYQGIDLIAPDIVRLSKPFRQAHLDASIAAAREQAGKALH
jgi:signal transduction histidine kinase